MVEEVFEAGAQVIQARFTIWGWPHSGVRSDEAVLGTFAVAGETHVAIQAVLGQAIQLVLAKLQLLGRGDHLDHVLLLDVAQKVVGFDEMVAGVEVAVVLDGQALARRSR